MGPHLEKVLLVRSRTALFLEVSIMYMQLTGPWSITFTSFIFRYAATAPYAAHELITFVSFMEVR